MTGIELYNKVQKYKEEHEMDFEHTEEYDLICQIYERCMSMEHYIGQIMTDNYINMVAVMQDRIMTVKCNQMEAELHKLKPGLTAIFDKELWKDLGYDV